MTRIFSAFLAAGLVWGGAGLADTLDFSGLPSGNLGTSVSVGGATIEGIGGDTISNQSDQYFQNAGGAVCAQRGSGDNCRGDMNIRFSGKVKKLSFSSAGVQAGDRATIVLYRGKTVVGSTGFSWNGKVNLATYGKVTRIKIEYEGVEDGMAIGKFNFTPAAGRHKGDDKAAAKPELLALNDEASAPARDGGKSVGKRDSNGKDSGGGKDGGGKDGGGKGGGKDGGGKGGGKGGGEGKGSGNKGK